MANLSPTTVAINTIAHNLANAAEAMKGLDPAMSQDLRALLNIAAGEIARVRKAARKAAAAAKRSEGEAKKSDKNAASASKKAPVVEGPAPAPKPKTRRKAANGMTAH
jgi:hypothetical protein